LKDANGEHSFLIFTRELLALEEDFSVGLTRIRPGASNICLFRCNGDHGFHTNLDGSSVSGFHVHQATADMIERGRKAEHFATSTVEYATFSDALRHVLLQSKVLGWEKYFPKLTMTPMFQLYEEEEQ
jgi:hypothetical protein